MLYDIALFPGQGAQYVGMGKTLYEESPIAREVFEEISDAIHQDVAKLCFEADMQTLSRTENAQIAIFTHSMAVYRLLTDAGISFHAVAGFSLGEYTALVASGRLSLTDGAKLVSMRGKLMQQAADTMDGGMAAVLGISSDTIEQACAQTGGDVFPVNFNCPGQIVIAGARPALEQAIQNCTALGAKRVLPLAVSGAFHTKLMLPAATELAQYATDFAFHSSSMPLYTNVTGEILVTENYPNHLKTHMVSAVRWQTLMEQAQAQGLCTGIEMGPGKTLCGFARKISKELQITSADTIEDVQKILA